MKLVIEANYSNSIFEKIHFTYGENISEGIVKSETVLIFLNHYIKKQNNSEKLKIHLLYFILFKYK